MDRPNLPEGFPEDAEIHTISINFGRNFFCHVAAYVACVRYWQTFETVDEEISDALNILAEYYSSKRPDAWAEDTEGRADVFNARLNEQAVADIHKLIDNFRKYYNGKGKSLRDSAADFVKGVKIDSAQPNFHNLILAKAFSFMFDPNANYKTPEEPCKLATGKGGKQGGGATTYLYIKPNGADHLDPIDKRFYNALDSIWIAQKDSPNRGHCTWRQLLEYAGYSDCAINRETAFAHLERMDKYEIWIDDSEEFLQQNRKFDPKRWKGRLLQYKLVPVEVNGRIYEQGIEFLEPIYSQYARAHGNELTTVEIVVLDSPGKNTLENIAIKNYTMEYLTRCWANRERIVKKISKMISGEVAMDEKNLAKLQKEAEADVSITFDYLYTLTKAENKLQKKRTRDSAERILKYYETNGFLHVKRVSKGEKGFKISFENPAERKSGKV